MTIERMMGNSNRTLSMYDVPMWESIDAGSMRLQCCSNCGLFRYPPAPVCSVCLAEQAQWRELSGRGTILSWVVFHRRYFDDHPVPYNAIAVQLEEGPIMVSNLVGPVPDTDWIGRAVRMVYERVTDGMLPRFELVSVFETPLLRTITPIN